MHATKARRSKIEIKESRPYTVSTRKSLKQQVDSTVVHDFNGHAVNGIHGLYGKKGYDEALYSLNKRHDNTGIHDINGNFPCNDIFRKNHARL